MRSSSEFEWCAHVDDGYLLRLRCLRLNGQCFGRVSNAYHLLELTFAVTVQRMQLKSVGTIELMI
jgi:hypothetical protein